MTILPQHPRSDPPSEPQRLVSHTPGARGTFRPHGRRPVPFELPVAFERGLTTVLWLVPLVWLAGYFWPPINHDVAALLDVSRRWLAGDRLYLDIIDVNLPLVFVIYALPELFSKLFGGTVPFWFNALCAIAIGGSFVACRRLLHRIPSMAHPLTEAMVPPTLLFLFAVLPNDNFGQREHLMLIACTPYIFEAAALIVFIFIGFGTALPQAPGMIGTYQYACVLALGLFGFPQPQALAYGLALNAIQLTTLVAQGLVALPLAGVSLRDLTRVRPERPATT